MTQMTQDEIVANTKTVQQGLEALRSEHVTLLGEKDADKAEFIQKSIENIELGLAEAQVGYCRVTHTAIIV